jgi:hypothetical protein
MWLQFFSLSEYLTVHSALHLKEALYGFPLAYLNCQHHYLYAVCLMNLNFMDSEFLIAYISIHFSFKIKALFFVVLGFELGFALDRLCCWSHTSNPYFIIL